MSTPAGVVFVRANMISCTADVNSSVPGLESKSKHFTASDSSGDALAAAKEQAAVASQLCDSVLQAILRLIMFNKSFLEAISVPSRGSSSTNENVRRDSTSMLWADLHNVAFSSL